MSQVYPWDRGTNYAVQIGGAPPGWFWKTPDRSPTQGPARNRRGRLPAREAREAQRTVGMKHVKARERQCKARERVG